MTDDEFRRLVGTYGAAPHRWPAHLKADALACLAGSPRAQVALQRAGALDDLLDSAFPEAPGEAPADAGRVVEAALAAVRRLPPARPAAAGWRRPGGWLSAGIVSGAMAAGIAVGLVIHRPAGDGAEAGVTALVLAPTVLSAMMESR
jgi:hypothetical protein